MNRRHFLVAVGAGSVSLSGCLAGGSKDAVVRLVQESAPEDVAVVSYNDLPHAEQRIVQTAIEENFYHACPELPEAVRSFSNRFEDPGNAFIAYQGTSYAVWVRIEDMIGPTTAPPPKGDPSCLL